MLFSFQVSVIQLRTHVSGSQYLEGPEGFKTAPCNQSFRVVRKYLLSLIPVLCFYQAWEGNKEHTFT